MPDTAAPKRKSSTPTLEERKKTIENKKGIKTYYPKEDLQRMSIRGLVQSPESVRSTKMMCSCLKSMNSLIDKMPIDEKMLKNNIEIVADRYWRDCSIQFIPDEKNKRIKERGNLLKKAQALLECIDSLSDQSTFNVGKETKEFRGSLDSFMNIYVEVNTSDKARPASSGRKVNIAVESALIDLVKIFNDINQEGFKKSVDIAGDQFVSPGSEFVHKMLLSLDSKINRGQVRTAIQKIDMEKLQREHSEITDHEEVESEVNESEDDNSDDDF